MTCLGIDAATEDGVLCERDRPEVGQEELRPHPTAQLLKTCKASRQSVPFLKVGVGPWG